MNDITNSTDLEIGIKEATREDLYVSILHVIYINVYSFIK
jgi:hypothetical protein